MPFATPYNQILARRYSAENQRNLPDYGAVRFIYNFEEGADNNVSMNNILFDSRTPATYGSELVTNGTFEGTYVGGVAPSWTAAGGVTATESSDASEGKVQRLTGLNGFAQDLAASSAITITSGSVYKVSMRLKKVSGSSGAFQIKFDGLSSTAYSIANGDIPLDFKDAYFYGVAQSASTNIEITSDDPTLVIEVALISLVEVSGGNHLVMDHNLYSRAGRGVNYYDFDGATQYFYIKDSRQSGLDIAGNWSYAAIGRVDAAATMVPMSKFNPIGAQRAYQGLRFNNGSRRYETYWTNGGGVNSALGANNALPAAPWARYYFMSMSFTAAAASPLAFYLDGVSSAVASSPAGTAIMNASCDFRIGAHFDNATGAPTLLWNGRLGKMVIWNGTALTASQHLQVFNILRTGYGI